MFLGVGTFITHISYDIGIKQIFPVILLRWSWRLPSALIREKDRKSAVLFSNCSVLLSALYTNNSDFLPLL